MSEFVYVHSAEDCKALDELSAPADVVFEIDLDESYLTRLVSVLGTLERNDNAASIAIIPADSTEDISPAQARVLIDTAREFQEDSRNDTRVTRFHVADAFYEAAGFSYPPAEFYEGFAFLALGVGKAVQS